MNATQHIGRVVLCALNATPIIGTRTTQFHGMGDDSIVNLPVYMLQPAPADIRCEPRRIPLGPNRAPGRAVTPYRHVSDPYRDRSSWSCAVVFVRIQGGSISVNHPKAFWEI
jgi:hypothetical protein